MERPQSWRRTADIAVSGLGARLSTVGLGSGPIGHPQAALAAVGAAMVGFLACGVSLWAQLLVGWRWSPPDSQAVTTGVVVMSLGVAYLAIVALLAAAPVVAAAGKALRGDEARRIVGPVVLGVLGVTVLVVGTAPAGRLARHRRPAVAAAPSFWQLRGFQLGQDVGPDPYWAHPSELLALPTCQLLWTLLSPVTFAATVLSAATVVRRVTLSARVLGYEARLAKAAAIGMVSFLGSAGWWVLSSPMGSNTVFRAGSLDVLLVAGMIIALAVANTATRRIHLRSRAVGS